MPPKPRKKAKGSLHHNQHLYKRKERNLRHQSLDHYCNNARPCCCQSLHTISSEVFPIVEDDDPTTPFGNWLVQEVKREREGSPTTDTHAAAQESSLTYHTDFLVSQEQIESEIAAIECEDCAAALRDLVHQSQSLPITQLQFYYSPSNHPIDVANMMEEGSLDCFVKQPDNSWKLKVSGLSLLPRKTLLSPSLIVETFLRQASLSYDLLLLTGNKPIPPDTIFDSVDIVKRQMIADVHNDPTWKDLMQLSGTSSESFKLIHNLAVSFGDKTTHSNIDNKTPGLLKKTDHLIEQTWQFLLSTLAKYTRKLGMIGRFMSNLEGTQIVEILQQAWIILCRYWKDILVQQMKLLEHVGELADELGNIPVLGMSFTFRRAYFQYLASKHQSVFSAVHECHDILHKDCQIVDWVYDIPRRVSWLRIVTSLEQVCKAVHGRQQLQGMSPPKRKGPLFGQQGMDDAIYDCLTKMREFTQPFQFESMLQLYEEIDNVSLSLQGFLEVAAQHQLYLNQLVEKKMGCVPEKLEKIKSFGRILAIDCSDGDRFASLRERYENIPTAIEALSSFWVESCLWNETPDHSKQEVYLPSNLHSWSFGFDGEIEGCRPGEPFYRLVCILMSFFVRWLKQGYEEELASKMAEALLEETSVKTLDAVVPPKKKKKKKKPKNSVGIEVEVSVANAIEEIGQQPSIPLSVGLSMEQNVVKAFEIHAQTNDGLDGDNSGWASVPTKKKSSRKAAATFSTPNFAPEKDTRSVSERNGASDNAASIELDGNTSASGKDEKECPDQHQIAGSAQHELNRFHDSFDCSVLPPWSDMLQSIPPVDFTFQIEDGGASTSVTEFLMSRLYRIYEEAENDPTIVIM